MSLTRTEVFQALADDKPIQLKIKDSMRDEWRDIQTNFKNLNDAIFQFYDWRIKPEQPKWYENIPKHGVLCWVSSNHRDLKKLIATITEYNPDAQWPFIEHVDGSWKFATPLTNDEIRQFLREEE